MAVDASISFMHCKLGIPTWPPVHYSHHARGIGPNVDLTPTNTGHTLAAHICLNGQLDGLVEAINNSDFQ